MGKFNEKSAIRVFLVRHGETEWNRLQRFQGRVEVPLNREGKSQARALSSALKNEKIDAIYSSPLARAKETAEIIKQHHSATPLFEEQGFLEMDLGEFDGMEAKKWANENPDLVKVWMETPASLTMPDGENLYNVQKRAVKAIDRITGEYPPGSTILITGHNFVNISILCHASNTPLNRFRELGQGTASLNVLYKNGSEFRADVINDRTHLKENN